MREYGNTWRMRSYYGVCRDAVNCQCLMLTALYHRPERGHHDYGPEGMCTPHRTGDISDTCLTVQQALQHILQKSSYNYPKRIDMNTLTLLQLGPGILWAEGTRNMDMNGRPRLLSAHVRPCDRIHASAPPEGHEPGVQRSATADLHPAFPADCSQGT